MNGNKAYTLTIYGQTAINKPITLSYQMLTHMLYDEFKKKKHIALNLEDIDKKKPNELSESDFIIVIDYAYNINEQEYNQALRSKCRNVVSFLECAVNVDHCFTFANKFDIKKYENRFTIFPAPYNPNKMRCYEKEKNSILLDHFWLNWIRSRPDCEWSRRIYSWLEELKNKYSIYCLSRECKINGDDWVKEHAKILPPFIKLIPMSNYTTYLKNTSKFETFIVTHSGSYNFTTMDMLLRGTRVFAPPKFIPDYNALLFSIPSFRNKEELIKLIKKPYNKEEILKQKKQATTFNTIANEIDKKLQGWL